MKNIDRRNSSLIFGASALVAVLLPLVSVAAAPAAKSTKIDLNTAEGALIANRKIQCSMRDGQPVVYWWLGDMYSRVPGERDKLLFKVEGMNIRQCDTVRDPVRGLGYRYVSRELLFYKNPQTGAYAKTWKNPWTGEEVQVIQVANDPVNARGPSYAMNADGTPTKWTGEVHGNEWWTTSTFPLYYDNPLQGEYQNYVGGNYHATEMFNTFGNVDDLVSDKTLTAQTRIGWERISSWLPWMKMGDRAGELYFHTAGVKLASWEDLPTAMKDEIHANYPAWTAPPPIDDKRPNETSWTYFKKKVPAGGAAAPR